MGGRSRLPDARRNDSTPGFFQVISLGDSGSGSNAQQIRDYKRRRPHKKSRGGCSACKQRRVKCDQAMPTCLRCRRNQRTCVYEHVEGGAAATSAHALEGSAHASGSGSSSGSGSGSGSSRSANPPPPAPQEVTREPGRWTMTTTGRLIPHGSRWADGSGLGDVPMTSGPSSNYSGGSGSGSGVISPYQLPAYQPAIDAARAILRVPPGGSPNFRTLTMAPFPNMGPEYGTTTAELLHHFHGAPSGVFGMPMYVGSLMPMATNYPHLRGTLLACVASHLCHHVPAFRGYRVAEHYQQALALSTYQQALSTPLTVQGAPGVDALLLTAMLMNLLSFNLPAEHGEDTVHRQQPMPRDSWIFSPHPNRLGWLAVNMGLSPLLVAAQPWLGGSFLQPLFANSDDERRTLSGTWQSVARVPQTWLDLFGIDRRSTPRPRVHDAAAASPHVVTATVAAAVRAVSPGSGPGASPGASSDSSSRSSDTARSRGSKASGASGASSGVENTSSEADRIFRAPLRVVAELQHMPATSRNVLAYFQFIGQLDPGFRQKLFERHEGALWLWGMWMGQLCRYENVWWAWRRSRCDFRAVRLWLHLVGVHKRPGAEGVLWRSLLADLDATWYYDFYSDPLMF